MKPQLHAKTFDTAIKRASVQHGVSAALVKAIIAAESGFDPDAMSDKGARGLMQLMPGEIELALAAYNAGPQKVAQFQGVPPYKETRSYVKSVLNYYKKYHADFR